MARLLLFGGFWLGLVSYAALGAPPDDPGTLDLILRLSTGQWQGLNPLVVALFNLMGLWPFAYAALLYFDGRGQKVPAWPFAGASFAFGAFALLPYLALRQPNPRFEGDLSPWLRFLNRPLLGWGLLAASLLGLGWGLTQGNWADYLQQFRSSRFIHVMSLDFVALSLLFPTLVGDDLARRRDDRRWLIGLSSLPLIGPCAYLGLRRSLPSP